MQWIEEDIIEPLMQMEIKGVTDIVDTLLYYVQAVDPTSAAALSIIVLQQAATTKQMEEACHQLLNYVATHPNTTEQFMANEEYNNGAILTLSTIIRCVVASASEAELAALFYNTCKAVPLCVTLEEMGHPQPSTPLITDNNTAHGLATGAMASKRSNAVDVHFYWPKCQDAQKQFNIKWKQGTVNRADYHSKHHHPSVHQHCHSA
eukprot:3015014-Ditylum_brightwellii.AAC.1